MSVQFGLVKQIQWVTSDGKPLVPSAQDCHYAQGLDNQGSQSKPEYGVFSTDSDYCGDPKTKNFLVYNGPNDTDGDTFGREAAAINDQYAAKMPLSKGDREQLIADKTALFDRYKAKASGTLAVTVLADDRFEFTH